MRVGEFLNGIITLEQIRENLQEFVGREVRLRANRGRKKYFELEGSIEQVYPKVFVVCFMERNVERRVSYSYTDLLTGVVEIFVENKRIGVSPDQSAVG